MANQTRIYVPPSHTKKIFGNIKRVEKGFSKWDTPLFPTRMVQAQGELGKDIAIPPETHIAIPTETHPTPIITQPSSSQPSRKQKPRKTRRQDTELPQTSVPTEHVVNEAVNEEMDDSLERATTTATSLDVEQDRGNISKTQSKATPNKQSSLGTSSGGGPRRQDTMRDTIAQNMSENVFNFSNNPPLSRVNTLESREDRLKLKELIELYTKLFDMLLNLESTKTVQAKEIANLKKRVNSLERKRRSRSYRFKRLYKVGLSARVESSADEESLVNVASIATSVTATTTTTATIPTISMDEITLAKALIKINTTRPKAKGIIMQEPSETPTTTPIVSSQQPLKVQDKGKEIMIEEVNLAWDDIQAKVDADYELAERLLAEEQEQLTYVEKAKLFMEFIEKRRKFFAAIRTEEKRNKPPTKAQQL
nr:hypothetical protein [Tanacetum cinerariifolium]